MILVSPLDLDCETHFDYFINENTLDLKIEIKGKTPQGKDAVGILNLNCDYLQKLRGQTLLPYLDVKLSLDELKTLLADFEQKIQTKPSSKFPEYCIVAINILKKMIN
jgi:hypothetical protein